jgi:hypothetical protein
MVIEVGVLPVGSWDWISIRVKYGFHHIHVTMSSFGKLWNLFHQCRC